MFDQLQIPGPEGRAAAIRFSLNQIAALPGADVAPKDLAAAFLILGSGGQADGDNPALSARRATCRDISRALEAAGHGPVGGAAGRALGWFRAQIDAWSESADPRQRAMAATAARELAELQGR